MDSNEKKPKRPRIGENRTDGYADERETRYEKVNYSPQPMPEGPSDESVTGTDGSAEQRVYAPRPYNGGVRQQGSYNNRYNGARTGGYQPRQGNYNNRYNNQGGYQPRYNNRYNNNPGGYQPRQGIAPSDVDGGATGENEEMRQGGYQPRQQGGYQPRHQGGYQPRQQGGYQPRHQGGYQSRQQGGYQPRQQGGYQPRQQGGYQPRQQGGYQPRQQGGYQPRQQGGYQQNMRQGGYRRPNGGRPGMDQNGNFRPQGKSFIPRPKPVEYDLPSPDPNEQIRLNKFMANAGICSRREADEYIQKGLVRVNGNVVTELGTKITHSDVVEYDEKVVALERKCYILLNKPKDCVTTSDDPNGRTTVLDLVKGACQERIYPVGRLDRNTTGVLLLTNDGDLASKLTHPQYVKKKIYHVWTDKDISEDDMQRIADGIELDDGPIHADAISYATDTDRNQAGIEIHSGRNRIVRRIFESLGYHVTKLDRVYFAGLTKKNLPRGRWRYLTQEEVNYLKMGSFE